MKIFKKRQHYEYLRKKWLQRHSEITDKLFDKHLKRAALSSLGGLMLLSSPNVPLLTAPHLLPGGNAVASSMDFQVEHSNNALLAAELIDKLPADGENLSQEQEKIVIELIKKDLGVDVLAEVDGKRLNRTYGIIGGEQHLYRYPGDSLEQHARDARDWAMFSSSGIAPALGAWGYFAPSKEAFTPEDELRERYYLAVQTWLSPGYAERVKEYRDFYKYRKMLVINPKSGQAVVAVIADAGPAEWTGKHLGGSPEVMHELGLGSGPRKGPVLYFFLNDPENKIPLGPLKVR